MRNLRNLRRGCRLATALLAVSVALPACRTVDEGLTRAAVRARGGEQTIQVGMERRAVSDLLGERLKWADANRATVTSYGKSRGMFDSRKLHLYFRDDVLIAIVERGQY